MEKQVELEEGGSPLSWLARTLAADARWLGWVAERRVPTLVAIMRVVTRTGDALWVTFGLGLALMAWPGAASLQAAAATVLALAAFSLLKRVCRRARPSSALALLAAPDRFSFPSGHSAAAFALAVSVALVTPWLAPLTLVWAGAVAASRVILGVHYPLDVAAGMLLGTLAALATNAL